MQYKFFTLNNSTANYIPYFKFCNHYVIIHFFQAQPSQAVVAAKRNAKMHQGNKKVPDVVIKDIYQTVRL
jgi:hypothetical protein